MIVIADSAPMNYLVLIGETELLPTLYGGVVIPTAVLLELRSRGAPAPVREWVSHPPSWVSGSMRVKIYGSAVHTVFQILADRFPCQRIWLLR